MAKRGKITPAYQEALNACRRFRRASIRSLARYLIATRPTLYESEECARSAVEYYRGQRSKKNTDCAIRAGTYTPPESAPPTRAVKNRPYKLPPGRWAILSDIHIPFHDQRALSAAVDFCKREKCNGVLLNGDAQDCEAAGMFTATAKRDFVAEVEAMADFLDWIDGEFSGAQKVYKIGNHENRLPTYYHRFAPHIADLPTAELEEVLSLDARGWEVVRSKQRISAGELDIIHGHEIRGGSTAVSPARWLMLKSNSCALCAHHHKTSQQSSANLRGIQLTTWSVGCLCNLSPDYSPMANQWNHGFAILHLDKNDNWELENHKILHNYKVAAEAR